MTDGKTRVLDSSQPSERHNPENWQAVALCKGERTDLFYPDIGGTSFRQVQKARNLCQKCEAIDDCLKAALKGREYYGIWGGVTPKQRRTLARLPDDKVILAAQKMRLQMRGWR